jgi:hypothetical protein
MGQVVAGQVVAGQVVAGQVAVVPIKNNLATILKNIYIITFLLQIV